jgi:UDP-glucose 4-epimerase
MKTAKKGRRVLITGVSGYLGRALCRALDQTSWCARVDGLDVRAPQERFDKLRFRRLDINDPGLDDYLAARAPDVVVHLAFVLNPIHDEALMRRINVDGTRRLLEATARAGTRQVMIASSGTAYGAWPDNPVPLKESDPIRPHPTFQYAREKAELEGLYQRQMEAHPEVVFSVIRPCVIYGPQVDNYLSGLLTALPVVVGLVGFEPPLQFVHDDDVARAIITIIEQQGRGAFNIAPPDTLPMSEALGLAGKPVLRLPAPLLAALLDLIWRLRLPLLGAPAPLLDFLRYPWVLDSSRLTEELGFTFQHSSREALAIMLRAKGMLA